MNASVDWPCDEQCSKTAQSGLLVLCGRAEGCGVEILVGLLGGHEVQMDSDTDHGADESPVPALHTHHTRLPSLITVISLTADDTPGPKGAEASIRSQ